jgi:ribonuclease HIII
MNAPKKNSFTYVLSQPQQDLLSEILVGGNYLPLKMEHTKFAARTRDVVVAMFNSGKCLVQGSGAEEFVTFILEPLVLQSVSLGYEETLNPELTSPHMGVDESGKGDFFGPLVIAAAYVDEALYPKMREMDVKDSKQITSDNKALNLGRELRELLGKRFSLVKIGPRAYNRLYVKMRNLNTLLAWAHARAIENLLEAVPDCPKAISDQFGRKDQVEKALMKKGRAIELVQRHKAESDMAVAAASIIAREQFLRALKGMAFEHHVPMFKGVSQGVKESAAQLIKSKGPTILLDVAKCHFKTTDEVLASCGQSRAALGPDGRAVSRPFSGFHRKPKAAAAPEPA